MKKGQGTMSMFARLLGTTAAAPAAAAGAPSPAAPAPEAGSAAPTQAGGGGLTEAQIEAALGTARAEGVEEGRTLGATAERERTAAVMGSDAGKKNMAMAAWMLASSPTATADAITAQLGTMPAASTAPAAPAAITTPLAETPKTDLGGGGNANDGGDPGKTKAETDKLWDGAIANLNTGGITAGGSGTSLQRGAMN